MQSTYYCPVCKAPVAYGHDFCGNCGTVLTWTSQQQLYYCHYCSSVVTYGHAACSICGTKLIWAEQQMTQAPAAQSYGVRGSYGQAAQDFQQQAYWQQSGWNPVSQYDTEVQTSTQEDGAGSRKRLIRIVSGLLFALIIGSGALIIGMNWNSITLYIQGGGSKSGTPVSSTEELAIGAFSASPETISPGQKSTLSWNTGGATSVSIDQGIGKVAAAGSSVVSPSDNITYTLTATGTSDSATASVTVSVVAVQTPIISSFTATPSGITAGQTSVLQWNVTGANSATIDQDIGDVPLEGPLEVSPSENTTYTLTATGTSDSATASVTVSVVAVQTPIISSFTATPSEITAGQTSVLQWNMTGANSATIDPDIGDVPLAGPLEVAPSETTTYTLTAQGETDTSAATVTVTVNPGE